VAAAGISGSAGYELGVQHSRIAAVAQGVNAAVSGPCPAGKAAPTSSEISPAGSALMARALSVPKGDKSVTGQEGVMSLSDYVKALYTSNPSEQARLVARCFQTAVHREWETPGGTIVSVYLSQFGQAADARSYTLSTEQGDVSAAPAGSAKFSVPGVADSMGLAVLKLDSFGDTLTRVIGDSGDTTMIIHVFIPAQANNAESSQILQAQNALLATPSS
jgi:hypothetical protein